MPHQIIDNRNKLLADEINQQLEYTEKAKIAVGYFFLSGLTKIQDRLRARESDGSYKIKEVLLLIGNTSNRPTIEQLAQSHKRLSAIEKEVERQQYPKRGDKKREVERTVESVREVISDLDQTDDNQSLLDLFTEMVIDKRLKVKVYLKSRLHAKAYIFDFKNPQPQSKGIAIVGSSNLSLAGLTNNTELNVYVHDNGENHDELTRWFNKLWDEAEDFNASLLEEMQESWARMEATPYDIYMKTAYSLLKDRLDAGDGGTFLWQDKIIEVLADFQRDAVISLIGKIKDFGGAFAGDVVGVGKSYIGAAVIKQFSISEGTKALIICPKSLEGMWKRYNAVYSLNAEIVSMSLLREGDEDEWNFLVADDRYKDRDFVLIDESHHFRHSSPQRYKLLQDFLQTGYKKVLLMTATPRNSSAMDVYHQIKLFHPDDKTLIPINPPNLKEYFKKISSDHTSQKDSNSLFQSLVQHILIRRTRLHIQRWYGFDSKTNDKVDPNNFGDYVSGKKRAYIYVGGNRVFFPIRELETISYSIEKTYQGLYSRIRKYVGKASFDYTGNPRKGELTYARFALWHYVLPDKQKEAPYNDLHRAGINLRGLIRILLFKRFESSVHAFRQTISRLIKVHEAFLLSIREGIIPAGDEAQKILHGSDNLSEEDLINQLREVTGKYDIDHFDKDRLISHISHDIERLKEISTLVDEETIPPEKDAKLQKLKEILNSKPLNKGKVLIFSESAETVEYLHENLNPDDKPNIYFASSGRENKNSIVNRFSPKANNYTLKIKEVEIDTLISTDVLAEGLNLQDCDKVINYDLHWNPVKLIQRFGRIDRIGSEFNKIFAFNFLPELELEKNLNLKEKVLARIQEIHDTIGEDAKVVDQSEKLNPEAMYAIYENDMRQLSLFEEEEEESITLAEVEEMMRRLQSEDPEEFSRIANLRDGIRTAVSTSGDNIYVYCQAGKFNQLYLVNKEGVIQNRDVSEILGKLKFYKDRERKKLPVGYNKYVQKVMEIFTTEVENRFTEQKHTMNLTVAQRYIIRELQLIFNDTDDEDLKAQINELESVFRKVNRIAVKDEMNKIKRNSLTGIPLLNKLQEIYLRHNLRELPVWDISDEKVPIPKVICSEIF